jgi:hypothetical protein
VKSASVFITVAFVLGGGSGFVLGRTWDKKPARPPAPVASLPASDACHEGPPTFDEPSRARALERFRSSDDAEEIHRVAASLGAAGGERAAQAAHEVLRAAGSSPVELARRAASLELLSIQEDPTVRVAALAVLAHERDASLRRAAVSSLGSSRRTSPAEAELVAARLASLIESDPDAEVRRRAVRGIARWRSSDAELGPILRALESDPDPTVRGACAYALEDERVRSPAALAALGRVVRDRSAPRSVRELGAEALARLGPLDQATTETLALFDRESR